MNDKSKSYRDLIVWKKSHDLVLETYRIAKEFPKEEVFGLTSQLRRAAISIPANIAEGFARKGIKDKLRFYNFSMGSLNEVDYYLFLSKELGYISRLDIDLKIEEIGKLLNSYTKSIQAKSSSY